jgi:hypothetical protein
MTHEAHRRQTIDPVLTAAGWHVCDVDSANLRAATGVAIREFLLNAGSGFADYLLCVKGKACGVIEAKKKRQLQRDAQGVFWRCAAKPQLAPGSRCLRSTAARCGTNANHCCSRPTNAHPAWRRG